MLLNILQGTAQPPLQQRIIWPQMSIRPRLRSPRAEENSEADEEELLKPRWLGKVIQGGDISAKT